MPLRELELVGAGGEPVDLRRTLGSHGVADLLPNRLDETAWTLETTLAVNGRARTLRVERGPAGLRAGRAPRRPRSGERCSPRSATCCGSTRIFALLRPRRRRRRAGLGDPRRGPDAAQPDGLRGRGQDRLHDQLRLVGDRPDGDGARRAPRRDGPPRTRVPGAGSDGRGGRRLLQGRRARRLSRAVPARDRRRRRRRHARPRGARRPQRPARRRGRRPAARAARRRPVRGGAHHDAARPLRPPDPRLVDAAEVLAAHDRPQDRRQDDRAPLPPLPRLRRARVLAVPHEGLGRGLSQSRARRATRAARPRRGRRGRRRRARARRRRSRRTAGRC